MNWFVWSRYLLDDEQRGPWCETPKKYGSKKAAHMAVADFDKRFFFRLHPDRVRLREHIALPEGMVPRPDTVVRHIKD